MSRDSGLSRLHTPLWWAEVKAGKAALVLVALLAAGTAGTAAVVPAKVARADQWVTDDVVSHATFVQRDLIQRENGEAGSPGPSNSDLVASGERALASMPQPVRRIVTASDVSVLSRALLPSGKADPATIESTPFYRLADLPGYEKNVRFVEGGPPTATRGGDEAGRFAVPIAVGKDVAARFHLTVGSTITGTSSRTAKPVVLTVAGIGLDLLVRREGEVTTRLRMTDYE